MSIIIRRALLVLALASVWIGKTSTAAKLAAAAKSIAKKVAREPGR